MYFNGVSISEGGSSKNLVIPNGTSFPANPDQGELFYHTTNAALYVYESSNTTWQKIVNTIGGELGIGMTPVSGDGNIQLTGGGITFPSTKNPSSNTSTLDDYEEGIATLQVYSNNSLSGSVNSNNTIYRKIGNVVTLIFNISVTSFQNGGLSTGGMDFWWNGNAYMNGTLVGSTFNLDSWYRGTPLALTSDSTNNISPGAGNLVELGSLPYAPIITNSDEANGSIFGSMLTTASTYAGVVKSNSRIVIKQQGAGSLASLYNINLAASGTIVGKVVYFAQ